MKRRAAEDERFSEGGCLSRSSKGFSPIWDALPGRSAYSNLVSDVIIWGNGGRDKPAPAEKGSSSVGHAINAKKRDSSID